MAGGRMAHAGLQRVRACTAGGGEGELLDMWTQTPSSDLPSCLNRTAACPSGSLRAVTSSGDQCVLPDSHAVQLKLRFRLLVACTADVAVCRSYTWLRGAAAEGAPPELAVAAVKLAQCFQVAWQEVAGAVLVWAGGSLLELFEQRRTGELWRRLRGPTQVSQARESSSQHFTSSAGGLGQGGPHRGEWPSGSKSPSRRMEMSGVSVEFAWRVDSYRLSPSSPTTLLEDVLHRNGGDLSSCLGIPAVVANVEWTTERGAPDLAVSPSTFDAHFKFAGLQLNEWPASALRTAAPTTTTAPVESAYNPWALLSTSTPAPVQAQVPSPASASLRPPAPAPASALPGTSQVPLAAPPPAPALVDIWRAPSPAFRPSDSGGVSPGIFVAVGASVALAFAAAVLAVAWMKGLLPCPGAPRGRPAGRAAAGAGAERARGAKAPGQSREAWRPEPATGPPPHAGRGPPDPGGQAGGAPPAAPGEGRGARAGAGGAPGAAAGAPGAGGARVAAAPHARITVGEGEPFRAAKAALAAELEASLAREGPEERRRRFKDLCLRLHPDKNGSSEESTSLFQFLQAQKAKFLDDLDP